MSEQMNQYKKVIEAFVKELVNDTSRQLGENFLVHLDGRHAQQLENSFQNPLKTPIGQQLEELAKAACGLIPDDADGFNRGVVYEGVQSLCEFLFARPGLGSAYEIPQRFWDTDLGQMVSIAWAWSRQEELITQSEAAQLANVSQQAINNAIRDGRLTAYKQANATAHRPGGNLVSKFQVLEIWGDE